MVLTRATNAARPRRRPRARPTTSTSTTNTTTPFVDQNQTYTSHPSHQVFLRAYALDADGEPVATGKLIINRDLGADGQFGTADDVEIGGMATWAEVKAQARDMLGINLTDADVGNVPLLATDPYGNFIPGPNGFPQVVMTGRRRHRRHGRRRRWWKAIRRRRSASPTPSRTGHAFLDRHRAQRRAGQRRRRAAADARRRTTSPIGLQPAPAPTTTSCSTRTTSPATAASTRTSA